MEKNPEEIDWRILSSNPNAIHLLEKNPEKIDWDRLSGNPNAIHLLEKNIEKLERRNTLSSNPNAIHLLEKKSGMTAIYNPSRKIFLSPMMDGPMKFTGLSSVEDIKIDNVSQHGRDFSLISVPYTLKLLIQELGCMNIQLRIITEDNIKQLENLASSFDTTRIDEIKRVVGRKRVIDDPEVETEESRWTSSYQRKTFS